MAYSAAMKAAIGEMRDVLKAHGLGQQSKEFSAHGEHKPHDDAPLVFVACSGGRDSLALAACAQVVCAAWGIRCGAIIVDHHLQDASHKVAQQAAQTCRELGLEPVLIVDVQVKERGQGIEAAAREARYAALIGTAQRWHAAAVLLAHTKDDQAESILIDLIRAAGTDAFAGMPQTQLFDDVLVLRPLLGITRAQTTRICEDEGLKYWDDPTNGDAVPLESALPASYPLRSRVRHDLMPYLSAFAGCDMVDRLARTARIARRDVEALNLEAERALAQTVEFEGNMRNLQADRLVDDKLGANIDARALERWPEAIRYRVIARTLAACGLAYASRHVAAVDKLVSQWHGQGKVALPSKYSAKRKAHVIRICEDITHANRRCAKRNRS